jgi:hypothetical protein
MFGSKGDNILRKAYDSVFCKEDTNNLAEFLDILPHKVPVPSDTIPSQYLLIDLDQYNLMCGLLPYELLRIFTQ